LNIKKERSALFFIMSILANKVIGLFALFSNPQQRAVKHRNHSTKDENIYKPLFSITQAIVLIFQIQKPNQTQYNRDKH